MKIAEKTVVQMHYTLKSDEGAVVDSSAGREPLQYIQGMHMIVPGLEKAMVGHDVGDKFDVVVIPAEGYGEYDERMTQEVPLNVFQGVDHVEAGMMFYAQTPNGPMPIRIKSVGEKTAVIDANHELAGKNLNFAIEVVSRPRMRMWRPWQQGKLRWQWRLRLRTPCRTPRQVTPCFGSTALLHFFI